MQKKKIQIERTVAGMAKTITGVDYEDGMVVGVTVSGILDADNDQPTRAYFQRVRHGRWIKDGDVVVCSECGEEHAWEEYRASYCEDCGAKMDLEDDKTDG